MILTCPSCSAQLEGDVAAGELVDCPSCGHTFEATPPPAPPPPSPTPKVRVMQPPQPKQQPEPPRKRRPLVTFWGVIKAIIVALAGFLLFVFIIAQLKKADDRRFDQALKQRNESEFSAPATPEEINLCRDVLAEIRGSRPPEADVDTFARLFKLSTFYKLDETRLLEANVLRAELALHYPQLATRFSIGPTRVSFDTER